MAEKQEIIEEKLDQSGLFDFKEVYNYAHNWFVEENYGVNEDKYSEKISGSSRDIAFLWKISKRLSDYFKIEIEFKGIVVGMSDVEVETDKEKKKMNKGKIIIEIKGVIVTDPENKWDVTAFYRFLRDVYNKYIIPGRIEETKERIKKDVRTVKEEIKALLELSGKR